MYSFAIGECSIYITYTRKSRSRNASACLYMCVYNLLVDFPRVCICVQWIKAVGPDTSATGTYTAMKSQHCFL